jgi:hypothetical protein
MDAVTKKPALPMAMALVKGHDDDVFRQMFLRTRVRGCMTSSSMRSHSLCSATAGFWRSRAQPMLLRIFQT